MTADKENYKKIKKIEKRITELKTLMRTSLGKKHLLRGRLISLRYYLKLKLLKNN